ncbi:flagellar hook protein FlgE [Methylobacterium sp. Leaf466]|uniref:flagellar hook protein FlgE n=1 Tax=Methylobacterium sp. Leaf466 TaxID=1736386 RepID=UPI0006F6EB33|nr:flagellar hook protein FlgE [Methylobacterium sp. Leaf466]KQT80829.1 flagellar biosynthesis protein FlgE [Methylobacterium sp. Leaf466]
MSLISVLRTGVSGMNAQSNRISTVAENIQNSSTTGYKRTSAEFSSLLIEGNSATNYNSGAVQTTIRNEISKEGPISFTTSKSDLAIQGNGFFVVQDDNAVVALTRAGNFVMDGETKNFVNSAGFTLMGYSLANGEPNPALNSTEGMVPVNLTSFSAKATPTTEGSFSGNLPVDGPVLAPPQVATPAGSDYSKKTSLVTFDNVGRKVTLDIYLAKTGANTWSASVYDAAAPASFPGTPLDTTTLTFGANGRIAGPAAASFTIPNGGPFTLDMSTVTQLGSPYDVKGQADGQAPSAVTGSEFGADGTVFALYEDGSKVAAFKVPLANVASPDELEPRAGNIFRPTNESGNLQIGFAKLGGLGSIQAGALEQSSVDVSTELTSMIESQTIYTANSKVFMTGDEMLDTLMNLKR